MLTKQAGFLRHLVGGHTNEKILEINDIFQSVVESRLVVCLLAVKHSSDQQRVV